VTPQEVGKLLQQQQYKFAKTMPWMPHWYTLKATWADGNQYRNVIAWILEHGELRTWGKRKTVRRYFDYGEWRYWPMTTNPSESILLNRAKIDGDTSLPVYSYNDVAAEYDQIWSGPQALQEDREIMKRIAYSKGDVLDIGCGTGLFLDHHPDCTSYLGIDPSKAMLERLNQKHPEKASLCQTFESSLLLLEGKQFDCVISLFCSPSYIPPAELKAVHSLVRPQGKLFMMFAAPDYEPITHQYLKNPPVLHEHNFADYGQVSRFGNYVITER
jgi:SAM-dependent methyltransferase